MIGILNFVVVAYRIVVRQQNIRSAVILVQKTVVGSMSFCCIKNNL